MTPVTPHTPVMLAEVLHTLAPKAGETIVDATFGNGGYSKAILESADCQVYAFDRDPAVRPQAEQFASTYGARFQFVEEPFSQLHQALADRNVSAVQGCVFDVGVSSMQLDTAERGFSFRQEGPLDMRMSQSGLSASDVVNTYEEEDLAHIFRTYGEEPRARAIAKAIVNTRKEHPLTTTRDLAMLVARYKRKEGKIDPATQVFQALRIYVNAELEQLQEGLEGAFSLLDNGGRLVVVAFHSLEDRIVKHFLKEKALKISQGSRYLPPTPETKKLPSFSVPSGQPLTPSAQEIVLNPRARSARLRFAYRMRGTQ